MEAINRRIQDNRGSSTAQRLLHPDAAQNHRSRWIVGFQRSKGRTQQQSFRYLVLHLPLYFFWIREKNITDRDISVENKGYRKLIL